MPDFYELRNAGQNDSDMLAHFRNIISSVGLTITGEKVLPDGHGIQILTQEGALPVYYYSGNWNVQGKNALEWINKLKGEILELEPIPMLDGPRLGDALRLRTGVLLHHGVLKEESIDLSKLMRVAGLEPSSLQVSHQAWGPILDSVEFYRQKTQYGIIVATPGELSRFSSVYTGLSMLVGMLGPRNVLVLLRTDEYFSARHFPSGVEIIAFDEIDEDTQASVYRVLFNRAETPLRLHIRDHASDQFWRSYDSSAGKIA